LVYLNLSICQLSGVHSHMMPVPVSRESR
jgi:hypothetical protein